MKRLTSLLTVIAMFLMIALPVSADQYGPYDSPKESVDISVDKMIGVPHSTKGGTTDYTYVDNLSTNDYRFGPQDVVYFRIIVKNTADKTLNNVVLNDVGPDYVQMLENPGTVHGNMLKIEVGTLNAGEEKEYIVKGRVAHHDNLPTDKGVVCVTNKARAGNADAGDEDNAQFCIEKSVSKTKGGVPAQVPEAGAAEGLMIMGAAAMLAGAGFRLRKIA